MTIQYQKIEPHWNYLLAIERDLDALSRYVEFDPRNFNCFSIEIARILLASAAEVDVVCKLICKKINPKSKADNINKYRDEIKPAYPVIPKFKVLLPRYGLTLNPWNNWTKMNGVPDWWTANNKIKHQRDSQYARANLQNALNAVAGLFVLLLYLYKEQTELGQLSPSPKLLRVEEKHHGGTNIGGYNLAMAYIL